MTDATVYSDEQAALIEAHSHARALAQRYTRVCDDLLEAGELRDRLVSRRDELDEVAKELESGIRSEGLMPHDINVDREDFARLADRFREWLDHERHSHLQRALADREADLLDRLEALQEAGRTDDTVTSAIAACRRTITALSDD